MAGNSQSVEITIRGHYVDGAGNNKLIANVFHYTRPNGSTTLSKSAIDTAFRGILNAAFQAFLSTAWIPDYTVVRCVDDPLDPEAQTALTATGSGQTGDPESECTSACFLLDTAVRGRRYKGRKHVGPISSVDTTNGELSGGGITRGATLGAAMIATFSASGDTWTPAVYSRTNQTVPVTIASCLAAMTPINGYRLNLTIGTMRRRKERTRR